jgi:cyclophilin family peptidyl-prolyl cis-trans isomerase
VGLDTSKDYMALIKTNFGEFSIDLYEKNAPNTVGNFIHLTNSGYYKGTSFYRLIPGFLVQGGSSTTNNSNINDDIYGGPGYTIPDEINWDSLDYSPELKSELTKQGYKSSNIIASREIVHYSVAMANNGPNTSGGQFFIVFAENDDPKLQNMRGKYTVFGGVNGGYSSIDKISQLEIDSNDKKVSRPKQAVVIENITILTK